ncbi:MAG TPA: type II toxin-antitoxin system RelE/ParE family toxin [Pyrinomonadaceae bacterium]
MKYKFHPDALEEYREAAIWYAKREQELAQQFIANVEDAIQSVVQGPTRWRIIDEDVRRYLTHLFPYAILYTIENNFILIVAVMHLSREPGYWRERIRKP